MNATHTADISRARMAAFAAALILPAVAGAVGGLALAARAGNGARVTADRAAEQLALAIDEADLSRAHAAIRAGADPNVPVVFTQHELTRDQPILVSPLVIASAKGDENMVLMLLANGVRLDDAENRVAWCAADALKRDSVRQALDRWIGDDRPQCPAPRRNWPVLLQLREQLGPPAPVGR